MAIRISSIAEQQRERVHTGITPFKHTEPLATTDLDNADDAVVLYFFGEEEAFISRLTVKADDLDSGTPALVFDVGIGDIDGTVDTVLISASDAGQAGGEADAGNFFPVEVTNKYLILDTTTAAGTAAAGNLEYYGEFEAGLRSLVGG